MKRIACLAVLGIAIASARADDAAVAKEWVIAGLNDLRLQNTIYIDLAGTKTVNGDTVNIKTSFLYEKGFDTSGKQYEKLECVEYYGGTMTQRIVGDSINLWNYDPINKTYSATRYGVYNGPLPENYSRNLMQAFMSAAKDQSVYIARLMLDAKAGTNNVNYTPWMPTASAEVTNYTNVTRVRYLDGNPTAKIITYLVQPDGAGGGKMTLLGYWDSSTKNNKVKTTTWLANITTGLTIDSSHFEFKPPAGSKGIVNVK